MSKKSPRQRRHARTRQEILDTALQLVTEKGADKLSLREIARQVDYSPAGLYEYFGSKEEIINALCMEGNNRLGQALKIVSTEMPYQEYLVELGLAYIRFAQLNSEFFSLMFTRLQVGIKEFPATETDFHADDPALILFRAIKLGIEENDLQTDDIWEMAYSFWATAHGLAMLQVVYLSGIQFDFDNANRHALKTLVHGMMNRQI